MKIAQSKHKNIFCIEGKWTNDMRDKRSIKRGLEFLEYNSYSKRKILHTYQQCSTIGEFEHLLKEATYKRYDKFSIIYLPFHGTEGKLKIGKNVFIDIDDIAEILADKAQNKIIHFGSCETMAVKKPQLNRFLKKTKALAVSGYEETVDFLPSTFLDLLYFQHCQDYQKMYLIERDIKKYYSKFAKELGFKLVYEK